jgi:uncharacterized surface protein with fasciclin (FAS1) repeats
MKNYNLNQMKTSNTIRLAITVLLVFATLGACREGSKQEENALSEAPPPEASAKQGQAFIKNDVSKPTVLAIAMGSENHTTLVAAVQAAELENALVNAGPLMVFAPTNEAFDALPAGTVENLLKPENKAQLSNILTYHVTPGNYSREFLKKFKKLGQANNQYVAITVEGDEVLVGGARILASIPAGNGIVHVIDKVLLPPNE